MSKIFVIASTTKGSNLEIEHFFSEYEAMAYLFLAVIGEYKVKPDKSQTLEQYVNQYYEWVREGNDNMCEVDVAFKIIGS